MKVLIGLAAAVTAASAGAQQMPLAEFVKRGTSLEKKGPLALLQRGEIRALQTELQGAARSVRDERLAAEKAGRKPAYCPPKDNKGKGLGVQEVLREMRAQQRVLPAKATTADGWRAYAAKAYPCPKV